MSIRLLLQVLAPRPDLPTEDEYGNYVGNPVGWDGSSDGLKQICRMMPRCKITCGRAALTREGDGSSRPDSDQGRPVLKIEYPDGKIDYVEAELRRPTISMGGVAAGEVNA
ncbi:hypothetical protein [Tunturiibacter gelidoferens]|uniref:hypothetical protein n=1 Tax=Tunturiibacter gelidiferens TaxID=3069689 RepID=UPI0015C9863D|nr:hypothetical protein [Edaphobacter lichenicola]